MADTPKNDSGEKQFNETLKRMLKTPPKPKRTPKKDESHKKEKPAK